MAASSRSSQSTLHDAVLRSARCSLITAVYDTEKCCQMRVNTKKRILCDVKSCEAIAVLHRHEVIVFHFFDDLDEVTLIAIYVDGRHSSIAVPFSEYWQIAFSSSRTQTKSRVAQACAPRACSRRPQIRLTRLQRKTDAYRLPFRWFVGRFYQKRNGQLCADPTYFRCLSLLKLEVSDLFECCPNRCVGQEPTDTTFSLMKSTLSKCPSCLASGGLQFDHVVNTHPEIHVTKLQTYKNII